MLCWEHMIGHGRGIAFKHFNYTMCSLEQGRCSPPFLHQVALLGLCRRFVESAQTGVNCCRSEVTGPLQSWTCLPGIRGRFPGIQSTVVGKLLLAPAAGAELLLASARDLTNVFVSFGAFNF